MVGHVGSFGVQHLTQAKICKAAGRVGGGGASARLESQGHEHVYDQDKLLRGQVCTLPSLFVTCLLCGCVPCQHLLSCCGLQWPRPPTRCTTHHHHAEAIIITTLTTLHHTSSSPRWSPHHADHAAPHIMLTTLHHTSSAPRCPSHHQHHAGCLVCWWTRTLLSCVARCR